MRFPILLMAFAALAAAQDFDLSIVNGRVVDGTGNPSFLADVGIKDGKIAAIGKLSGRASRAVFDAKGLTVAPGFIDMHNHSDNTVLSDGNAQSMIRQGVTSMIFGEGGSAAPSSEFPEFKDYFAAVLKKGISPNIGTYIGSAQVWTHVHGQRSGLPAPDELQKMRAIVRTAMEQGALGVASSLSGPPGNWIDTGTMIAMCEEAGKYNGIYSTHMRTEGKGVFEATAEAMEIARKARVPVDIIHLKIAEHSMWGQMPELVATIANARARGEQVEAHIYPYRAGQNNLASIIPPWAHEGGRPAMLKRLQDPSLKQRLHNEIKNGIPGSNWYNHFTATGTPEGMLLVSLSNPAYKKYEGKRLSDIIKDFGGDPVDVLFKVLIDNNGSIPTVYFHHSEDDMRFAMKQPFVSFGSDGTAVNADTPRGNPHPRYYGTFPRILGRYVRDAKLIAMEEAIRKMTSANAAKVRLYDRGLLRPGMAADVTVFNQDTIIDHATFEKPHQYATGVELVVVNGKVVLERGKHTGTRPGAILYGQGYRASR